MKYKINLIFIVFFICSCVEKHPENKNRKDVVEEISDLRLVELKDTINNIIEYYSIDKQGYKQGKSYSLDLKTLDTTQTCNYYNDTLLNYINRYNSNIISEIISVKGKYGEYLLQDWLVFDSSRMVSKENSCYVEWNYDLSNIIELKNSYINLIGQLICEGRGIDELKVAYSMNEFQSDTVHHRVNETPDLKIELEKGMNRIKLFYSSKSFVEKIGEEVWLDREYLIFVNRK